MSAYASGSADAFESAIETVEKYRNDPDGIETILYVLRAQAKQMRSLADQDGGDPA